jgi:alkanesulfonate monooxygenase SsuD/methylene tetrahydromethanopterin reductase-like flavin-dependent oxidoreductase (luciferase family)
MGPMDVSSGEAGGPSTVGGRPARTGIVVRDPLPWRDVVEIVRTAEDVGYEAVFVPEIQGREAFVTLTGLAEATRTLRLGTGVVTTWSRSPATTAMAAATLQDVSGGRHTLGLGSGTSGALTGPRAGARPLERVRRYLTVLRALFDGRVVEDDPMFGTAGFGLDLLPEAPPPLWLGALGDGMVRLAGEAADGVILNWCTPERVRQARASIALAAAEAGRDPDAVTISVYVRACLGLDEDVALLALRVATGGYASLPHYRKQMAAMGLGTHAERAAVAMTEGKPERVPEELVRALCVLGGRGEALARFEAYRRAGADLVLCYPVVALERQSSFLGTVLAAAPDPAVER